MNSNLKEFIDKYKGYNSSISEEELYDICVKHKSLPKSEKNWDELAEYLNIGKSSKALQNWIYYHQTRDGSLPITRLTSLVGSNDDLSSELQLLYKERTKTRDAINTHRYLVRDEARVEQFREDLRQEISGLQKLPFIKFNGNVGKSNREAILMLSDLHIGVEVNTFANKYNINVAAERLGKLTGNVIKYCKENNVKRLNVINLGDMIHGIIHTNARITEQTDVISQVITAAELISEVVNELQEAAPEVLYRSCSDNHSRVMANKSENIEKENFGRIIDWFIKERLRDTRVKFMDDNLDYGLGRFSLLNGKVVMFSHGHEDVINSVFQSYVGATKQYVDYILLGHFHTAKMKTFQGSKVMVNGSIVGTEDYALSKRYFGDPEQLLLVVDGDNLLTYNINLK